MSNFICPICNAEYSQKQKICTCGFEGIEYIDYYNPLRYDEDSQNTIFKIYKFSKKNIYRDFIDCLLLYCVLYYQKRRTELKRKEKNASW